MACNKKAAQIAARTARTGRLWEEYTRDPSQWGDNRKRKRNPRAPTKEALWMDGWSNPTSFIEMKEPCSMKAHAEVNHHNNSWDIEETLSSLEEELPPPPFIEDIACMLHTCRKERNPRHAMHLHAYMRETGLDIHTSLGNYLVSMLVEVGSMNHAQQVFERLGHRDESSWNSLITGYSKCGKSRHALLLYQKMREDDSLHPSRHTFIALLKACVKLKDVERGDEIHAEIARKGFLERDVFVGSTLVDMYAKCGSLEKAQEVFDKLSIRNIVSWTTLIAGYAEHGRGEEALNCFEQMQHEGIALDAVTFVCSLKACGSTGAKEKGREIHAEISRKGMERDLVVGSTLVDMYAKCGSLVEAQEVFYMLPAQDVVSWTALITGYVECGHGEEALCCFEQMQHKGFSPDAATFVCSLKACGSIGATDRGQEVHAEIIRIGLERNILVGSALVDMYAKCGFLANAQEVFDKLPARDVVSWTALMAGYTQLGESEIVFHIFDRMIGDGIKPNLVTFSSVLNACSHAGLVDKGQMYFDTIMNDYGLIPTLAHYTCVVDLLSRAGHIDTAVAMIKKMPCHPGIVLWHVVLGACRKWGNVELGRHAFEHVMRLDEKDAASYVCMYNIYADASMQEDANKVEAMRVEKQAWKKPGYMDKHQEIF